jgi:adenylate cyclase, class 2
MPSHNQEIEIKLPIEDIAALRGKLRKLHAKAAARVFERNDLYDTPRDDLRSTGRLLRIRVETPSPGKTASPPQSVSAKSLAVLTYKAPIEGVMDPATPRRYKQREELEINFHPAGNLEPILRALGFRPGFRYEKFRTQFTLPKLKGLHLDLDETPIGNYLELEGPPAAIDRAAKLLGFSAQDYITATYWDLYVAHCVSKSKKIAITSSLCLTNFASPLNKVAEDTRTKWSVLLIWIWQVLDSPPRNARRGC